MAALRRLQPLRPQGRHPDGDRPLQQRHRLVRPCPRPSAPAPDCPARTPPRGRRRRAPPPRSPAPRAGAARRVGRSPLREGQGAQIAPHLGHGRVLLAQGLDRGSPAPRRTAPAPRRSAARRSAARPDCSGFRRGRDAPAPAGCGGSRSPGDAAARPRRAALRCAAPRPDCSGSAPSPDGSAPAIASRIASASA